MRLIKSNQLPFAERASFGFQTYGPGDDLRQILNGADTVMYVTKRARGRA